MTDSYRDALMSAEQELVECIAKMEALERQRARLSQTVTALKSLLGIETSPESSLTDAILLVVRSWNGFVTAAEVLDRLVIMGYQVQASTVATLLSRLTKNQQIIAGVGPNSSTGYAWRDDTTPSERLSAAMSVMKKSKPA